ncbi:TPA: hypothetical protein ACS50F_002838 [Salmonella enterica]
MRKCFFTTVLVALLAGTGRPASRLASERERSPTSNAIEGRRGALWTREMTVTRTERGRATPKGKQHTAPLLAAWRIVDTAEKWT